ncbi:hypothetical protein BD626DRAFT_569459 [Schizophyllum amplum]|uniref:Uncharacterized protein n=1 Tax=Schizophyllum amplum TaxID=97359 RepID=A0A550CDM4_9AGAR|nr:hypothetical protein BD626DRAFT_569459 [Auriculariopsis ampla]
MASIHDTEGISHVGIINSTPEEVEWLQAVAPGAVSLEVPGDITAVHSAPKDQLTHKLAMWEWVHAVLTLNHSNSRDTCKDVKVIGLSYERFIQAILEPGAHEADLDLLCQADLLLGGPALNRDWLHPAHKLPSKPALGMKALQETVVLF